MLQKLLHVSRFCVKLIMQDGDWSDKQEGGGDLRKRGSWKQRKTGENRGKTELKVVIPIVPEASLPP